jgi:hypothetical protein
MSRRQPEYYDQPISEIDFRKHPELYRVGKGEQGVLIQSGHLLLIERLNHYFADSPRD